MDYTDNLQLSCPSKDFNVRQGSGVCDACGALTPYEYVPVVNPVLARQWELSNQERELWSARESMYCAFCGCSYRLRMLARAINNVEGDGSRSLLQGIEEGRFDKKKVAEINSCGVLHETLKKIPSLKYSEYESIDPTIPHEDLQDLSYKSNSFDFVFTSDVLEHVPDPDKAISEIYRILKPGGNFIFSVPLIMDRKTKMRAYLKDGKIIHNQRASFHGSGEPDYLVWNEFGYDFIDTVRDKGFFAYYVFVNSKNFKDPVGVIVARKGGDSKALKASLDHTAGSAQFNEAWQVKRVQALKKKLDLTSNHVLNLEAIIKSHEEERVRLDKIIEGYQKMGFGIPSKVIRRLKKH